MRTRDLGFLLFGLGIFVAILVTSFFFSTNAAMAVTGCPLEEGGVLCAAHQALPYQTAFGLIAAGLISVVGLILIIQDKQVVQEKKEEAQSSADAAVMKVLTDDEKKIMEAVQKEQGITQSTLRFKTDFSQAKLSELLTSLERRNLIKKQLDGKTNKVFTV